MTPILYSKPGCQQCIATARKLDQLGIEYDYRDTSTSDEYKQEVVELGYMGVPVVVTSSEHWQGYNPDKLLSLSV